MSSSLGSRPNFFLGGGGVVDVCRVDVDEQVDSMATNSSSEIRLEKAPPMSQQLYCSYKIPLCFRDTPPPLM